MKKAVLRAKYREIEQLKANIEKNAPKTEQDAEMPVTKTRRGRKKKDD